MESASVTDVRWGLSAVHTPDLDTFFFPWQQVVALAEAVALCYVQRSVCDTHSTARDTLHTRLPLTFSSPTACGNEAAMHKCTHMEEHTHGIMLNRRSVSDTHMLKRTRVAREIGRFFSLPDDRRRGYVVCSCCSGGLVLCSETFTHSHTHAVTPTAASNSHQLLTNCIYSAQMSLHNTYRSGYPIKGASIHTDSDLLLTVVPTLSDKKVQKLSFKRYTFVPKGCISVP